MATVFLSYRSRDSERGTRIAESLRRFGHVVLTGSDFPLGTPLTKSLFDAMSKADMGVFVVSDGSANAEWMTNEIGAAVAISEAKQSFKLIPVVFDRATIPSILAQFQAIFTRDDDLDDALLKIAMAADYSYSVNVVAASEDQKTQERIEENAAVYIKETFSFLKTRETTNKNIAYACYSGGLAALIVSVCEAVTYTHASPGWVPTDPKSLPALIYLSLRGLIIIGLLVGISKYAFNLGKVFMNEGLRNSDRYHAISFGSFYLKAFGDKVTWEQLKEVFQTWNIDSASAFTKLDAGDYDPKFLEAVVAVAQTFGERKDKKTDLQKDR